jgi:HlyD family secretion protein
MRFDRPLPAAALLLLSTAVGCNRPTPHAVVNAPAAPPAITVVKLEKRAVKRVIEQPGTIQAFEETVLYPKIPGYVHTLGGDPGKADPSAAESPIDIGSRVKKDQVLAELAAPEMREEFKQKEALILQAEAEVIQSKKSLAAAAAEVLSAKARVTEAKAGLGRVQAMYARWQSEVDRVNRLSAGGLIDTQSRDETQNQFKSAEAGRDEMAAKVISAEAAVTQAEADRDKAEADVTAVEARLAVARADARRVTALLSYLQIKAPFDGVVTRRNVSTGDFVTADGKHGLFAVARIDPVRVVVNVPEADAGSITVGQEVRFTIQAMPTPTATGKIVRTSWSLDPSSRTLRAELDLPNPDGKVRPGMYAYARILFELPEDWTVPAAAVGKVNDESVLYLVENGKAIRVAVQLARGDAQVTQIRRYKRSGSSEWTEPTGMESFASPASAVTDGQTIGDGK